MLVKGTITRGGFFVLIEIHRAGYSLVALCLFVLAYHRKEQKVLGRTHENSDSFGTLASWNGSLEDYLVNFKRLLLKSHKRNLELML